MTWYVVSYWDAVNRFQHRPKDSLDVFLRDLIANRILAGKEEKIWTLSRDPEEEGWETDCGEPGYGLTYADAKELADAANAAESKR